MGRRKYSYRGKPHGRNELIREYIWLYYLRSLAPGQAPDPSMRRCRKQVSSHIQVLKGFFKDHPACKCLFSPFLLF
jgi:transcriptional enhancer factor